MVFFFGAYYSFEKRNWVCSRVCCGYTIAAAMFSIESWTLKSVEPATTIRHKRVNVAGAKKDRKTNRVRSKKVLQFFPCETPIKQAGHWFCRELEATYILAEFPRFTFNCFTPAGNPPDKSSLVI